MEIAKPQPVEGQGLRGEMDGGEAWEAGETLLLQRGVQGGLLPERIDEGSFGWSAGLIGKIAEDF
jgi:hypothetical protein